jgi:hypothetical protein
MAGCGASMKQLDIDYLPEATSNEPIPSADRITLHVEELTDMRDNKAENLVGEAKTGIFNKSTPITIEGTVAALCTKELREALATCGFRIVDAPEMADVVLRGRINAFWIQEYVTGYSLEHSEAEVELDVALFPSMEEDPLWYDVKRSFETSKPQMDATAINESLMNQAFRKTVAAIVSDGDLARTVESYAGGER